MTATGLLLFKSKYSKECTMSACVSVVFLFAAAAGAHLCFGCHQQHRPLLLQAHGNTALHQPARRILQIVAVQSS
jgi:hypothetical protein